MVSVSGRGRRDLGFGSEEEESEERKIEKDGECCVLEMEIYCLGGRRRSERRNDEGES